MAISGNAGAVRLKRRAMCAQRRAEAMLARIEAATARANQRNSTLPSVLTSLAGLAYQITAASKQLAAMKRRILMPVLLKNVALERG